MGLWICVCVYGCFQVPTNAHECHHGSQHMELTLLATAGQAGLISSFTFFSPIHAFSCVCVYSNISSHLEKDGNNF